MYRDVAPVCRRASLEVPPLFVSIWFAWTTEAIPNLCGIVGFCDTLERRDGSLEAQRARLSAMMDRVRHRGPDGEGTYVDATCSLGHLRLKIIDLSDRARQPMTSVGGEAVLAFNGEIYNFRALRAELAANHTFVSTSDTEVLLNGYLEWGDKVFSRANGMFAVAIWNPAARRLVLARDRLGKKPLFYYWDGSGRVVFGSQLSALLEHPIVDRVLDEESLAHYFRFGYVPTPRTIFKNVFKVPQGSMITFEGGRRTIEAYWELPSEEVAIDEEEAVDELDHLLQDAVRIRLESDVPVGFFLSGGLDSSLVTAIACKLAGPIRTFTAGFADRQYDESRDARAIASHLGTQHIEVQIEQQHFADFLETAATYYDEPFGDSSMIATYYLARATKEHVTVALSGDGGDELFCGYQKYRNLQQLRPALRLPHRLRAAIGKALSLLPSNMSRKVANALQSDSLTDLMRWLVSIWKPDELAKLMPHARADWDGTQLASTWARFGGRDDVSRLMAGDIKSYLCDDILQKVDRASMAVALEIRCPLLDYRVVEFAMRLPLGLKVRAGRNKYLLRKLLARYLPPKLWDLRPKHGLNVPVKAWYRGERRQRMVDTVRELGERLPGVLSIDAMNRVVEAHISGRVDYSQKLFTLESFNYWMQSYR